MGNISGQSKNDQIHLFLENINIPHLFHQASWELIRFFGPTILDKIDGKFVPLSPHQNKDGKMARFGFCAVSTLIMI